MNFSSASICFLSSACQSRCIRSERALTRDALLGARIRLDGDDGASAGLRVGLPRSLLERLESSAGDVHLDAVVGERVGSDESETGSSTRDCRQRTFRSRLARGTTHRSRPSQRR